MRVGPRTSALADSANLIHIHECGGKSAEALKVAQAVTGQVFQQPIEVCNTILQNGDPLVVHFRLSIQVEHRAAPDHRVQGHQLPFIRAGKVRPAFAAVLFPE